MSGLCSVPARNNGACAPLWPMMCIVSGVWATTEPHCGNAAQMELCLGSRMAVLTMKCAWAIKAALLPSVDLAQLLLPHLSIVSPNSRTYPLIFHQHVAPTNCWIWLCLQSHYIASLHIQDPFKTGISSIAWHFTRLNCFHQGIFYYALFNKTSILAKTIHYH